MPRKKKPVAGKAQPTNEVAVADATSPSAVMGAEQPTPTGPADRTSASPAPPSQPGQPGEPTSPPAVPDPYRATFTCAAKGFEWGENRRFKQVVVAFKAKPEPEVLKQLSEAGFTYRPHEKAWTIPASAVTRELATRLALEWSGQDTAMGR